LRARRLLPLLVLLGAGCADTGTALPADVRSLSGTAGDAAVLRLAETVLIAGCMHDAGFDYPLDPAAVRDDLRAAPATSAPITSWPEDDEQRAARTGLGPAAEPERRRTDLERYVDGLDPGRRQAFSTALHGDPAAGPSVEVTLPGGATVRQSRAGCGSQAQRRLYGDLDVYLHGRITADNLTPLVVARVTADRSFVAAQGLWRVCMAEHGWPVADQAGLAARVAEIGAEREREAAALAARCNRRAALSATARRLTPAAEQQVRADLAPLLTDLSRREQAALPSARRVLAGEDI